MPTASAKVEKVASNEAFDPLKQILILVEKKVRNLEKRKGKLDNYRNDHKNGKELNEDQKNAVKKYDQVIEVLEFAKELQKSFNAIFQESARLQKKFQKKELAERQHHEFQQIRQLLIFQDMLARLQSEEVQNDFLNGENGAVKLSKEEIEWLGEFHKTVLSETKNGEEGLTENSFSSVAEHFLALLEAKNRDILGTTYKHLKELLLAVQESGYFSLHSVNAENGTIPVPEPELQPDETEVKQELEEDHCRENGEVDVNENGISDPPEEDELVTHVEEESTTPTEPLKDTSNHQLHDVLAVEGTFDFLQESQIDMESPHMDPAVVAAHPMAPPPSMNYQTQSSAPAVTSAPVVENGTGQLPATVMAPFQAIAVSPPTADTSMTLSQAVLNHPPQDYDPNQPIPTQTFTNQNFVAMQNTMNVISPPYVPVTAAPSFAPVMLIKRSSDVPQVGHSREISSSVCGTKNVERTEKEPEDYMTSGNAGGEEPVNNGEQSSHLEETPENQTSNHYPHHAQNHQSRNFNNRGMRGGRGRGSSNGYARGRGGYGNGRGYYQNSYGGRDSSGSSTGYNGYRRGSRGGPRGGARGGNRGGRGNYRPQQQ